MPQPPRPVRDLALLLARVVVGVTFVAHGLQKFLDWGIDGTAASFDQMGIPLPEVSAWFAALVETLGGAALLLGAALPVAGILLTAVMLGALFSVHLGQGFFVSGGGVELVLLLAAAALALGFNGGRFSVDHALSSKGSTTTDEPSPAHR
ncbi:DoxX family protein [Saccharomonospora sp. NB11]|jgi:putative oxidoreductase|uniref:DoxX family protein n=1 Tax=Saccharomonospora sp. NB11 TaxID=1642298 RepID=UPI0018D16B74|nr:DoxX family protein [Saccharomonospora sp. NB11]